ncbi:MAG: hypothetical protein AAGD13_09755 [Pseudomonadota bacterium]
MSSLAEAVNRLDAVISDLETAVDGMRAEDSGDAASSAASEIVSERDTLADEVQLLRRRAEEDAQLRAEAAEAVREALRDLRGAVDQEVSSHA